MEALLELNERFNTHLHRMLNGAIRRTICCLSFGIFRRGILL